MALSSTKKLIRLILVTLAVLLLTILIGWNQALPSECYILHESFYIFFYAESVWMVGLFVAVLHEFHDLHKKREHISPCSMTILFCSFLAFLWIEYVFFTGTVPGTALVD